jgi:putative flippase GtrA
MNMAPAIPAHQQPPAALRVLERVPTLVLAILVVMPWIAMIALVTAATLGLKLLAAAPRALIASLQRQARSRSAIGLLTNEATGQFIRFAVAGLGVTALSTLIYLVAATSGDLNPLLANTLSHLVGVVAGYAVHSRWSFRAETGGGPALRFAAASGAAFALNSAWVWLATGLLALPSWSPVPAMLVATPLASFALNRYWVFAAARA